ncbi:hypothetical protein E2C01_014203 [Portunus trituberculatus]|uniref:Uncharacterized protein n=1 Tax=Portunus trituberculatus TaxID=210409 RepID=A0A5B7DJ62_PORTR|nr:hypothetical protein [Portunus trituberculatus]
MHHIPVLQLKYTTSSSAYPSLHYHHHNTNPWPHNPFFSSHIRPREDNTKHTYTKLNHIRITTKHKTHNPNTTTTITITLKNPNLRTLHWNPYPASSISPLNRQLPRPHPRSPRHSPCKGQKTSQPSTGRQGTTDPHRDLMTPDARSGLGVVWRGECKLVSGVDTHLEAVEVQEATRGKSQAASSNTTKTDADNVFPVSHSLPAGLRC